MCGSSIGKVINKVTSFHDKIDPFGKAIRGPVEAALGLPSSSTIGTELFPSAENLAGSTVKSPATVASDQDAAVLQAREDEKRRRLAAAGQSSTILTGAGGLSNAANTGMKTVLGA